MKVPRYCADFETTTKIDDCRVWAWGVIEIGKEEMTYANNIESFMDYVTKHPAIYYFHNLSFDGNFIIYHLFKTGYTFSRGGEPNTFNVIISRTNTFYQIELSLPNKKKVKFLDSMKILPFSVEKIGHDFNVGLEKLEIDYHQKRPKGYILIENEVNYLRNDIAIVARALEIQFDQGLKKMTAGSNALAFFKKGIKDWSYYFPVLDIETDGYIRRSYRGGFVSCKESEKRKLQGKGLVFDVNSLYPSVMYDNLMPFGVPIPFDKEYKYNEQYPIYIQHIICEFKLKRGKIPMIQIKRNPSYISTDYVTQSVEPTELYLTGEELKMFQEHYDVYFMIPIDGFMFQGNRDIFKPYIDYWMNIKVNNKGAIKQLAKLMLNSLYGKFATNPDVTGKYPIYNESKDVVEYILDEPETRDPVYTAVGVFITSYGRIKTISTSQSMYDRWLYSDTDSIHIKGTELPNIDIDENKLGAWKLESEFSRAKFIRAKTYVEEIDGKLEVKCAGMTDKQKESCTFDNFDYGLTIETGKLKPKRVPGGVVLLDTAFNMRK